MNTKKSMRGGIIKLFLGVGVIIYLAAIVITGFQELTQKPVQGITQANLETIRSSLSIYYHENKTYPLSLDVLTVDSRYLIAMPITQFGYTESRLGIRYPIHPPSKTVKSFESFEPDDAGGWGFVSNPNSRDFGKVFINCTHTDLRGKRWFDY